MGFEPPSIPPPALGLNNRQSTNRFKVRTVCLRNNHNNFLVSSPVQQKNMNDVDIATILFGLGRTTIIKLVKILVFLFILSKCYLE